MGENSPCFLNPVNTASHLPRISYILPVYNRAPVVEQTLLALFKERDSSYPNLEIIVMDGGSKDGTLDILNRYASQIDHLVSEKDSGVADAINKGLALAKGDILRYVACDDVLLPGTTLIMAEKMMNEPAIHVMAGRADYGWVDKAGTKHTLQQRNNLSHGMVDFNELITWCDEGVFAPMEAWFVRREVYDKLGGLDLTYKIACDLEWAFRFITHGYKMKVLPERILEKLEYSDLSNTSSHANALIEWRAVTNRYAKPWQVFLRVPRYSLQKSIPRFGDIFIREKVRFLTLFNRLFPGLYRNLRKIYRRGKTPALL